MYTQVNKLVGIDESSVELKSMLQLDDMPNTKMKTISIVGIGGLIRQDHQCRPKAHALEATAGGPKKTEAQYLICSRDKDVGWQAVSLEAQELGSTSPCPMHRRLQESRKAVQETYVCAAQEFRELVEHQSPSRRLSDSPASPPATPPGARFSTSGQHSTTCNQEPTDQAAQATSSRADPSIVIFHSDTIQVNR
jgi:hypothetical protein